MVTVLSKDREKEEQVASLTAGLDLPHTETHCCSRAAPLQIEKQHSVKVSRSPSFSCFAFYRVISMKSVFPIHLN